MCMECCENTYVKYLEKDNEIKLGYLKTLGTIVSVTHVPDTSEFAQWAIAQGHPVPMDTTINIDGVTSRFCMCDCHHVDKSVIH